MSKKFKPKLTEVYMTRAVCLGETMCSNPSIDYIDHSDRATKKTIQSQYMGYGWEIGDYSSFDGRRFIVSFDEITALRKLLQHLEVLVE